MALRVYLKKVKMSSFLNKIFLMHIMPTTEVIGVINSLDKDQILDFLKHFVFSETFPFPKEYIV